MSSVPQSDLSQHDPRGHLIDTLRRQLDRWGRLAGAEDAPAFSCGVAGIDRLLPGGGLRHGMLVEWVGKTEQQSSRAGKEEQQSSRTAEQQSRGKKEQQSSRAVEQQRKNGYCSSALPLFCSSVPLYCSSALLALLGAREACREGGELVVIDRQQTFYPPAAAAWGIDLDRLIVVRPRNARDELWAAVESLRSPAVAAIWTAIDRLDSRAFRRLQLAAQAGRTLGLIMRPPRARVEPSWADVTLEAGPLSIVRRPLYFRHGPRTTDHGRPVQVQLVHCRGGHAGGSVVLEIDDAAHTVQEDKTIGFQLPAAGPVFSLKAES
jgi:hypothetical protein